MKKTSILVGLIMGLSQVAVAQMGPGAGGGMGQGPGNQGQGMQNNMATMAAEYPAFHEFQMQQKQKIEAWKTAHKPQRDALESEKKALKDARDAAQADGVVTEAEKADLMKKHQQFKQKAEKMRAEGKVFWDQVRADREAFCKTNSCPPGALHQGHGDKGGMMKHGPGGQGMGPQGGGMGNGPYNK